MKQIIKTYLQIWILKIQIIKLNTQLEDLKFQLEVLEDLSSKEWQKQTIDCLTKKDFYINQLTIAKQTLKNENPFRKCPLSF